MEKNISLAKSEGAAKTLLGAKTTLASSGVDVDFGGTPGGLRCAEGGAKNRRRRSCILETSEEYVSR